MSAERASWVDQVVEIHGDRLTSDGNVLLDVLGRRPELAAWTPPRTDWPWVLDLLWLGHLISRHEKNPTAAPIIAEVSEGVALIADPTQWFDEVPMSRVAELMAGGVLEASMGADDVRFIPETTDRTPDIEGQWDTAIAEVEVTRADQRHEHREAMSLSERVINAVHGLTDVDLTVHCATSLSEADLASLVEAVPGIAPGEEREQHAAWRVRADDPSLRDPLVIYESGTWPEPPSWWPEAGLDQQSFVQAIATLDAVMANPRTRVGYRVSFDAYLNSARNKAERPQSSGDRPFVVAIDVSRLRRAFNTFRAELPRYWMDWTHISGVLLIERYVDITRDGVGWTWELLVNPHADHPLPPRLTVHLSGVSAVVDVGAGRHA